MDAAYSIKPTKLSYRYELSRFEPKVILDSGVVRGALLATQALLSPLVVIDVAEELGRAGRSAAKSIIVYEGAKVRAGQLVAETSGPFGMRKRGVTSPCNGIVKAILPDRAAILVRPEDMEEEVHAHFSGTVAGIGADGIEVESLAMLVHGVAGFGGRSHGILRIVDADADLERVVDSLLARAQGYDNIVIAFRRRLPESLVSYIRVHPARASVAGILTGTMDYDAYQHAEQTGDCPSIIITEGFGSQPLHMGARTWEALKRSEGEAIVLSGEGLQGISSAPTVVLPVAQSVASTVTETPTAVRRGVTVRTILGTDILAGKVSEDEPRVRQLPSGYFAESIEVDFGDGASEPVALTNLEVLPNL